MKYLFACAGGIAVAMTSCPASAAVYSVGGPLSYTCYRAALGHDIGRFAIDGCTRSLNEEALSDSDRAATLVNRGVIHLQRADLKRADADFI